MAFNTASTVTPTSAKTAIHMVPRPMVARISTATWQLLLVYLIPYLLIGHETLGEAAEGIAKGDMFNENFLMAIATIGALCIGFFPGSDTEFPEAVFVMLFFQV
jgi:Zn2+/Cd2+-exporting ATPase